VGQGSIRAGVREGGYEPGATNPSVGSLPGDGLAGGKRPLKKAGPFSEQTRGFGGRIQKTDFAIRGRVILGGGG